MDDAEEMAGASSGTERIDITITDQGTVKQIAAQLDELADDLSLEIAGQGIYEFGDGIHQIAARVRSNGGKLVKKCASVVQEALIENTPKETGRAASNWVAQVDDPFEGVLWEDKDFEARKAANEEAIAEFDGSANQSIHITNNLRYITPLNDGHSQQAPAGFVEMAVQMGAEYVGTVKNGVIVDGD